MVSLGTAGQRIAPGLLLGVFASAIFLSAGLLFAVQPLFAKMVLPRLGGSPSVWSVAVVFFQGVLLAGYAYAHVISRWLPARITVLVHLAVMLVAATAVPLAISSGWGRPPFQGEALWLLGLFGVSIGLPFFALSANGPLLQAWFARTSHPAARDPYFLYAASNAASFLALVSYPLLLEPFTRLGQQVTAWSVGFYALIVLIAASGMMLHVAYRGLPDPVPGTQADVAPTWRDAAVWVVLSAVPSALLIAVTAHISTDVAAAPLMWVVPLALYLVTFVIVFQTRPILPHRWMLVAQPISIIALVGVLAFGVLDNILLLLTVNLLAFFFSAMVCHGELARRRPTPHHLTAFYMWLSAGGVIGGIAAGLIAPRIFSWVMEYPLLIVAAVLCRPGLVWPRNLWEARWVPVAIAVAIVIAGMQLLLHYTLSGTPYAIVTIGLLAAAFVMQRDIVKFAVLVALTFLLVHFHTSEGRWNESIRSFFGVHRIVETEDGMFRILMHGTTTHGAQQIRDANGRPLSGRPEPLTYYHTDSPLAQGIAAVRERAQRPLRLAMVGLGTGSLACQSAPGDEVTYYEIDRSVVRLARESGRFTYLAQCAPNAQIIMGDARLTLADAADGAYDVLAIDAFSSDAIPIHLLTREAMAIYLRKLAPGGLILVHVSNRHLELASVVAGIAEANGLTVRVCDCDAGEDDESYKFSSLVAAVARSEADFGKLAESDDWTAETADPNQRIWTDDYSNIVGALIRKLGE
jgi:hypothetical protein